MYTQFARPRHARILDAKYARFSAALAHIGLAQVKEDRVVPRQEFRVVGMKDGRPVVHPNDHMPRETELTLNPDIVEFVDS